MERKLKRVGLHHNHEKIITSRLIHGVGAISTEWFIMRGCC